MINGSDEVGLVIANQNSHSVNLNQGYLLTLEDHQLLRLELFSSLEIIQRLRDNCNTIQYKKNSNDAIHNPIKYRSIQYNMMHYNTI